MSITVEEYRKNWPAQEFRTSSGASIKYRWHRNPDSDTALVLLIGTIGNSDAFYEHFGMFAKEWSVLTLDYPEEITRNNIIADSIAELIESLGVRAWLLGQSLGGFIAQIIAQRHPDIVEGLVLSNTACLAKDISPEALISLSEMASAQSINQRLVSVAPMSLIKKKLLSVDPQLVSGFTPGQKAHSEAFSKLTADTLTRQRLRHSLLMMADLPKQFGMLPEEFAYLDGRVLLLLSPDDGMFVESCREALVKLMPSPKVDSSLTGGHLAIFLEPEEYVKKVSAFIKSAENKERNGI